MGPPLPRCVLEERFHGFVSAAAHRELAFARPQLVVQANAHQRGVAADGEGAFAILPERCVAGGAHRLGVAVAAPGCQGLAGGKDRAALDRAETGPATIHMRPRRVLGARLVTHHGVREAGHGHCHLGVDGCRVRAHGIEQDVAQDAVVVKAIDGWLVAVDDARGVFVDDCLGARGNGARHGVLEHDEAIAFEIVLLSVGESAGVQCRHGFYRLRGAAISIAPPSDCAVARL